MVQLSEIKKEIEELPKQEYVNLRHWFAEKDWKIWDKQIKEDSNSGKLDLSVTKIKHTVKINIKQ